MTYNATNMTTGDLISILISLKTSQVSGLNVQQQNRAKEEFVTELNKRLPQSVASALDEVKGEVSATQVTQNFDARGWPITTGYYFVQFMGPLEIVWYDVLTTQVQRMGKLGSWSIVEFRWLKYIEDPKIEAFKS